MFAIIALIIFAIVALAILSVAVHILFSPLLLLVAVVGVLAWMKFRPRRSRSVARRRRHALAARRRGRKPVTPGRRHLRRGRSRGPAGRAGPRARSR